MRETNWNGQHNGTKGVRTMTQDLVTTNPQSDSALAQMDVFPDFAITLDEARRRIKMLQEFVRDQMVDGEDYGVIPGTGSKPTLLKPGAEKLNAISDWHRLLRSRIALKIGTPALWPTK
jgi:hypothetical protein